MQHRAIWYKNWKGARLNWRPNLYGSEHRKSRVWHLGHGNGSMVNIDSTLTYVHSLLPTYLIFYTRLIFVQVNWCRNQPGARTNRTITTASRTAWCSTADVLGCGTTLAATSTICTGSASTVSVTFIGTYPIPYSAAREVIAWRHDSNRNRGRAIFCNIENADGFNWLLSNKFNL